MPGRGRILIAKPGLDGHSRGAKVVALALVRDGFEVVYTGLRHTPEQIAAAAVEEDVDAVGLSILSGAHLTCFAEVIRLLKEAGAADIPVFGGGIIPTADIPELEALGVAGVFGPGTPLSQIVEFTRRLVARRAEAAIQSSP